MRQRWVPAPMSRGTPGTALLNIWKAARERDILIATGLNKNRGPRALY